MIIEIPIEVFLPARAADTPAGSKETCAPNVNDDSGFMTAETEVTP